MSKSALDIISEYIQMLQAGHVKEGLREATKEEVEFGTALLQAVAADLELGNVSGTPGEKADGSSARSPHIKELAKAIAEELLATDFIRIADVGGVKVAVENELKRQMA